MSEYAGKPSIIAHRHAPSDATSEAPGRRTLVEPAHGGGPSAPVQRASAASTGPAVASSSVAARPTIQHVASSSVAARPTIQQLFGGHLQRTAGGGDSSEDTTVVHASAQQGIATSASALPHAETIQRSFGRHDISGIHAHTGATAAASARAMGAEAYATGTHVVLGERADLHTVAHETAHVVQQRAGVHLKDGVGATGDRHEQHADRVADAVVQGRSSEALLDQVAGPAQGGTPGAVQMLRSDPAENDKIATVQWRLLKAFDFDLARHAINFRIESGELDTDDLTAIRDSVLAAEGGFEVASAAAVGRANQQRELLQGKMVDYRGFLDGIVADPRAAETLRGRGEEAVPEAPATEAGWTVICDQLGRRRIEVPTAKAAGVEIVPLSSIKWSQKDVAPSTSGDDGVKVTNVIGRMNRGGWRGDPLEVVDLPAVYEGAKLPDNVTGRCSMDNRRLLAAVVAGLDDGPARVHAAIEAPDEEWAADQQNKLKKALWQHPETHALRSGGEQRRNEREGYAIKWAKDLQPRNYAEMILFRTANQGNLKFTQQSFPIGGSNELPFVREERHDGD